MRVADLARLPVQVQQRLFAEDMWQRFWLPLRLGSLLSRWDRLRDSWKREGSRADDIYQVRSIFEHHRKQRGSHLIMLFLTGVREALYACPFAFPGGTSFRVLVRTGIPAFSRPPPKGV
jgi:hypothetical protein